jgi:NADH dehydrogenase
MMNETNILLIGGSGFIGQKIASGLSALGHKVFLPTRKAAYAKELWVLPKLQVIEANVHDPAVLADLCQRLGPGGVVINLVGILHDKTGSPYGPGFLKNHVELTKKIIAAMNAANLKRYIHMSALGANSSGASMYQRSKGDAENLVKSSDLDWTIFRPSVVFGEKDKFINLFASLQKFAPVLPLGGANVKFQPVYVSDVAQAFVKSISMSETIGRVFDLAGPRVYTLAELVKFAGMVGGRKSFVIPLPNSLAYLQAGLLEMMPGPTLMSRDNLASMSEDNVLPAGAENALEKVFDINPQALDVLIK